MYRNVVCGALLQGVALMLWRLRAGRLHRARFGVASSVVLCAPCGVLWLVLLASGCFQRRRGALLAQLAGTRRNGLGRQCTQEEKKEQDAAGVPDADAHATEDAAARGGPPRPGLDQGRGPAV